MKEAKVEDYKTAWKDIWYHLIEMEHQGIDITNNFKSLKYMLEYHLRRAIITRKDSGMDYKEE
jgi:hypothetical protein